MAMTYEAVASAVTVPPCPPEPKPPTSADAPAADLYLPFPQSPLLDFAMRGSTLRQAARGGFPRGTSLVAVDFVAPFLPLAFQQPVIDDPPPRRNRL